MEIEHLREFLVLAESLSLSEAADQLYLSQSTVSRHLQQLERTLGTALFFRTSRRLEINLYGRLLLPYAQQIVELYDGGCQILAGRLRQNLRLLVVGSLPAMTEYPISATVEAFRAQNPGDTVQVVEGESYELKDRLLSGACDLAFVREMDESDQRFCRIPFCTDRLVVVLPRTHVLAAEAAVRLEQLRGELFLTLPAHTVMYDVTLAACREAGFTPEISMQSHHIRNALDMISHQVGVSISSECTARTSAGGDTVIVPIEPARSTQINLLYCQKNEENPLVRRFLAQLAQRE